MSKQELKEEFKQTEGDPMIKARLRQIRTERARRRMMAAVPEADVVITNPTHYAVALKYDHGNMEAPVLVAKGIDSMALRIREVAEAHEVAIVENPPLSRALSTTSISTERSRPNTTRRSPRSSATSCGSKESCRLAGPPGVTHRRRLEGPRADVLKTGGRWY